MYEIKILEVIKEELSVDVSTDTSSKAYNTDARRIYCHLLTILTSYSSYDIAKFINRDHTGVLYLIRTSKELLSNNKIYIERYKRIYNIIAN